MKMQIKRTRPQVVQAPTKNEVISRAIPSGFLFSSGGTKSRSFRAYTNHNTGEIIVFNLEKRRQKMKVETKRKKVEGKMTNVKVRTKVRDNHWIAYVYRFNKSALESVVQNSRNFEITVKI